MTLSCRFLWPKTCFLSFLFVCGVSNDAEKANTLSNSSNLVDTKMMSQQRAKGQCTHSSVILILQMAPCDIKNHKTKFLSLEFQHGVTTFIYISFQGILIPSLKKVSHRENVLVLSFSFYLISKSSHLGCVVAVYIPNSSFLLPICLMFIILFSIIIVDTRLS